MKVVTGEVMQQIDRRAIKEFGVPGLDLMERAGANCAELVDSRYGMALLLRAVVVAGKGNNGGDGFVIARLLQQKGWEVEVHLLARRDEISGDARANLERLPQTMLHECLTTADLADLVDAFRQTVVVIDAVFGTGLKSTVTGHYAQVIELINNSGIPVVAVDIPSGIDAATGRVLGTAVRARQTVTFALPKLGHVLADGPDYTGELRVTDIGIPADVITAAPGALFLEEDDICRLLRPRSRNDHKGSYGHCLIIAGSSGKTGAAAMAANSAVRGGAGLVSLACPASLHAILEIKTTEAMTLSIADGSTGCFCLESLTDLKAALDGRTAIALGPGIGWGRGTVPVVHELLEAVTVPLVVDADGLNAVSEQPGVLLSASAPALVLTPHPGEMARLLGATTAEVVADRAGVAARFARDFGVYLILKGAGSIVAAPDGRLAINSTGNPGMATGGTGDVLAGLLTALLAQGYEPFDACCIAVFVHGLAGDMVARDKGATGMSAVDVQEMLPYAFHRLSSFSHYSM